MLMAPALGLPTSVVLPGAPSRFWQKLSARCDTRARRASSVPLASWFIWLASAKPTGMLIISSGERYILGKICLLCRLRGVGFNRQHTLTNRPVIAAGILATAVE